MQHLLELANNNKFDFWQKSESIVKKITKDERVYYTKYKQINLINSYLLKKHLNHEIKLGISIKDKKSLFFVYNGQNVEKFCYNLNFILEESKYNKAKYFKGNLKHSLIAYFNIKDSKKRNKEANFISNKLENFLEKSWKFYPQEDIPKELNVIEFPYEFYQKQGQRNG